MTVLPSIALRRRAAELWRSNLGKYVASDAFTALTGFLLGSYVLVVLGAEDFGRYTLFLMLAGLFGSFCHGSASRYLIKHYFDGRDRAGLITAALLVKLGFTLAGGLLFLLLLRLYPDPFFSAWFFPLVAAQTAVAFLSELMRLGGRMDAYVSVTVGRRLLFLLFASLLIGTGTLAIETLAAALGVAETLAAAAALSYVVMRLDYRPRLATAPIAGTLRTGLALLPHKLFRVVNENLDSYLVTFVLGPAALGVYRILKSLASPVALYAKAANKELTIRLSEERYRPGNGAGSGSRRLVFGILLLANVATVLLGLGYDRLVYDFGAGFPPLFAALLLLGNLNVVYYALFNAAFYRDFKAPFYFSAVQTALLLGLAHLFRPVIDNLAEVVALLLFANLTVLGILVYVCRDIDAVRPYRRLYLFGGVALLVVTPILFGL